MPKRPQYIAALVVAALLAVRLTGPELTARYSTVFDNEGERDGSAQSRVDLWRDALTVIESRPVFGVGPANWTKVAASYGWPEGKSAHSVWMETAADVGVPGVLWLFAFFTIPALKLWSTARAKITEQNRYQVGAALAVVLGVVGFVVAGQFVSIPGLEVPYYVNLVGLALLKEDSIRTEEKGALVKPPSAPLVTSVDGVQALRPRHSPTAPRLIPPIHAGTGRQTLG